MKENAKTLLLLALAVVLAYLLGQQRAFGAEPMPRPAFAPPMPMPQFTPACICGTACKCEAGTCPGKCPVVAKAKRVRLNGYWWDQRPDGTLVWCLECNGPYPGDAVAFPVRTTAAPGVAAPAIFRPAHNPTHDCPSCGRAQYVVSGPGPVPGTHTHRCGSCGSVWWH